MTGTHGTDGTQGALRDGGADSHREIVSLADIRERRVPLEWYEAVAIVAGLCSALVESQATTMPAAGEIVLAQDGTIVVRYPSRNTDWVGLPRLLHKLLSVAPQQTPLRLFVLNAISSDGDKSPAAFGAALAYYERPGRDALIRGVRERFFVTPVPPPGSQPDDVEEPEIESPPKTTPPPSPAPRRKRLLAAALVMSASVVAVTLVAGRTPGSRTSARHTNALAGMVAHVAETGREVARGVGTAMTAALASRDDEAPTATPAPTEAPRARAPRPRVTPTAPAAISTADPISVTVVEPVPAPVARDADAEAAARIETPAPAAPAADHAPGEIVPARLLEPVRLPGWAAPAAGTMTEVIELDISPTGAVDRVRLISPAMRMTDMMILSAAKTWIFQPASQDGQPVPYRMTLKWVSPNP